MDAMVKRSMFDMGELFPTMLAAKTFRNPDTNMTPTGEAKREKVRYPDIGAMLLHPHI